MSKILCTFPGRTGDILWALPTVRMIARFFDTPVTLAVSKKYGDQSLLNLIEEQWYVESAISLPWWEVEESAPMGPRVPPALNEKEYDEIFHLGYEGWPKGELAKDIWERTALQLGSNEVLDMKPWIIVPYKESKKQIFCGWSQEWIELKMGVTAAVENAVFPRYKLVIAHGHGMRHAEWNAMFDATFAVTNWMGAADLLQESQFYLGCLSAQWVLANAMGKRCVVVEPSEPRWHPVFWREDEKNVMVRGGDGKPTFDARHVVEVVKKEIAKCV